MTEDPARWQKFAAPWRTLGPILAKQVREDVEQIMRDGAVAHGAARVGIFDPMRLRKARRAAQMSQVTLADRSGVELSQIGRYERAELRPSQLSLEWLAGALKISPEALLFGGPDAAPPDRSPGK